MEEVCKPVIDFVPELPFWLLLIYDSFVYQKSKVKYKYDKHGLKNLEAIEEGTSGLKSVVCKQLIRLFIVYFIND